MPELTKHSSMKWKARKEAAKEKEEDQTLTSDVVIIGAGGAGMAAAVSASQAGNVIVIEKSTADGCNTILSGGTVEDGRIGQSNGLSLKSTIRNLQWRNFTKEQNQN